MKVVPASFLHELIPDLSAGEYPVLGEGLWGRVIDLRDGSVLKIARRTAGIGDGVEKVRHECAVMQALEGSEPADIRVPKLHGFGMIDAAGAPGQRGYEIWSRMEKLPGASLDVATIKSLSAAQQQIIGASIGRALALFHEAALALPDKLCLPDGDYEAHTDAREIIGDNSFYNQALDTLIRAYKRIPAAALRPCHGDFNISNLLFNGQHQVTSIMDFAESYMNFAEKDISDITNELPALKVAITEAYEKESGFRVDPQRLLLGEAENAFYGALIAEFRRGDEGEARQYRETLVMLLAQLETCAPGLRTGIAAISYEAD